jgi:hypothetical protein
LEGASVPDVHVAHGALTPELCAAILPRLRWTGSLGPAGNGNRATDSIAWRPGERSPNVLVELFDQLVALRVLPLERESVDLVRGWASSTPAGVPIAAHAHDGDVVVAVYLAAPEDPEPLDFIQAMEWQGGAPTYHICKRVYPEPGLVLMWPSLLEHRVTAGERRAGARTCCVWNVTLRSEA